MTEDELFATPALRVLEPGPGGLDRVRGTLDHRRPRWWLLAIPAAAAVVIIAIVLAGRVLGPSRAGSPATAQLATLVADPTIASSDRVSFYWVASQSQPATPSIRDAIGEPVDAVGRPPTSLLP